MCLISRISTCRREKYLANTKTKTSFIKSTGWNEKSPKLNQLFGPPPKLSKRIRINKTRASSKNKKKKTPAWFKKKNKKTRTPVCLKKRKSMKAKIKKTVKDIATQIICRLKKSPPLSASAKDFIVTSPPATTGRMKKTSNQSILCRTFSAISYSNLAAKISKTGIISFATTGAVSGSGQVK